MMYAGCQRTFPTFLGLLKSDGMKRRLGENSGDLEPLSECFPRSDELARVIQTIVDIGLRGGWVEFQDTPLKVPKIQLTPEDQESTPLPHDHPPQSSSESKDGKAP